MTGPAPAARPMPGFLRVVRLPKPAPARAHGADGREMFPPAHPATFFPGDVAPRAVVASRAPMWWDRPANLAPPHKAAP